MRWYWPHHWAARSCGRVCAPRRLWRKRRTRRRRAPPWRGHIGWRGTRPGRVGRDPELTELDGQGLGEALQAGLCRGVVDLAAVAERGGRGQVDDAPEPLPDHVLLHGPGHLEGAAQVHA